MTHSYMYRTGGLTGIGKKKQLQLMKMGFIEISIHNANKLTDRGQDFRTELESYYSYYQVFP